MRLTLSPRCSPHVYDPFFRGQCSRLLLEVSSLSLIACIELAACGRCAPRRLIPLSKRA